MTQAPPPTPRMFSTADLQDPEVEARRRELLEAKRRCRRIIPRHVAVCGGRPITPIRPLVPAVLSPSKASARSSELSTATPSQSSARSAKSSVNTSPQVSGRSMVSSTPRQTLQTLKQAVMSSPQLGVRSPRLPPAPPRDEVRTSGRGFSGGGGGGTDGRPGAVTPIAGVATETRCGPAACASALSSPARGDSAGRGFFRESCFQVRTGGRGFSGGGGGATDGRPGAVTPVAGGAAEARCGPAVCVSALSSPARGASAGRGFLRESCFQARDSVPARVPPRPPITAATAVATTTSNRASTPLPEAVRAISSSSGAKQHYARQGGGGGSSASAFPPMLPPTPPPQTRSCHPERLAEAARRGDEEATRAYLLNGASSTVRDRHGWTPLHYAAADGHLEVCRLLLSAGADRDAQLPDLSTPLMLAVEEAQLRVASLLLQLGARAHCKDEVGFTALDRCATSIRDEFAACVQDLP